MASFPLRSRVALAACVSLATLAFTQDASAYCRLITQQAPSNWNAPTQGCYPGDPTVKDRWPVKWLYWRNSCIGFSMQRDASSQASLEAATAAMGRAFQVWEHAPCEGGTPSIHVVDEGPVICGEVVYNEAGSHQANQHTIVFRDTLWPHSDNNNTLALTTMQFDIHSGEIFDADMEINTADHVITVGETPPPNGYRLDTILTHETGHFLGLDHSESLNAVMYSHYGASTTELTADDIAGVCTIYPPGGKRVTSDGALDEGPCDPTPRHGWASECHAPTTDQELTPKGCACAAIGSTRANRATSGTAIFGVALGALAFGRRKRRARG